MYANWDAPHVLHQMFDLLISTHCPSHSVFMCSCSWLR